jgi:hypothetical protein
MSHDRQVRLAENSLAMARARERRAYAAIPEVAIRVIEEIGDVMELDFAVRQWRQAKTECEVLEKDQRLAGLRE